MHEIAICQSIVKTIENEMDHKDLFRVREIHLKVGILSCVDAELLKHVFTFIKADTPFQEAVLKVDVVAVEARCNQCGHTFKVEKYMFICPQCGSPASHITEGNELLIHKIVLEEPAHEEVNQ